MTNGRLISRESLLESDVSYVSRSRVDISISYSDNCRFRWIEKEKSPTKYNCERKGNDRRIRSSALFFFWRLLLRATGVRGARWTKVTPNHRSSIFVLSDTDLSIPFVFKTRVKSQPSKIDLIVGKTFESISISNDFAPSRKTERQMDA